MLAGGSALNIPWEILIIPAWAALARALGAAGTWSLAESYTPPLRASLPSSGPAKWALKVELTPGDREQGSRWPLSLLEYCQHCEE